MRLMIIAVVLASLPLGSIAAPNWQNISAESGRRIELDRSTLKREGNSVEAQSRVTLDRDLIDGRTGSPYRIIEAVTRYDCSTRSARTIKRTYKPNEKESLREEDVPGVELPVRSGTLDDRVLREVCRPPKENQAELVDKANDAASKLKLANEAVLKKEMAKAPKSAMVKTADVKPAPASASAPAPAAQTPSAPLPSIRPNLKAAMENGASTASTAAAPPSPAPATPEKPIAPAPKSINVPAGTTQTVRNNASSYSSPAPRPAIRSAFREAPPPVPEKVKLAKGHWDYEGAHGPANWGKLDSRYKLCATGQRQSPIDIRGGSKVDQEVIRFDYRPSTFRIVDNGHSVSVGVSNNSFSLTGKTYTLEDIHFHSPAEMQVDGKTYAMSIHLVHRAKDGSLAVVDVLLERGIEHPELQLLWNYMPMEKNKPQQPPGVMFNAARLLPDFRNYTSFIGSLTTPPCTEGVLWLVMKQPMQVSDEQIRMFQRLYRHNARPVQPIGERLIKDGR